MLSGILSSAMSGLSVNAQRVAAAADNVANARTHGYKRAVVQSKTLATQQTSTTSYAPGFSKSPAVIHVPHAVRHTGCKKALKITGDLDALS